MSGHRASVFGESPDKQRITQKNKVNNTSDISFKRKETIKVPDNLSKSTKEDIKPDVGK